MGRASRSSRKQVGKKTPKANKTVSVADLVEAAEESTARCEYDDALLNYQKALEQEPENTALLDAAGEVLLEIGQVEQAKQVLTRSIQLNPNGSFSPYMWLGQLTQGVDAVACYERGVALLKAELEIAVQENQPEMRAKLAAGLCAKAEVYMTDLCDTDGAEAECQAALEAAVQYDPENVDALLTAANFSICQQRGADALGMLDRAAEVMRNSGDENRPPTQICLNCAKMYVELQEHEKAIEQLQEVLTDNDELTEAHFMLAVEFKAINEVEHARESVTRAHQLYSKDPEQVPEIMQKILDLVASLQ